MNLITIEDLGIWDIYDCEIGERYDEEYLKDLLDGRPGWTPLEIANENKILSTDRIWILLRPQILGDAFLDVVNTIILRTIKNHAFKCGVPAVEAWAERWLNDKNKFEDMTLATLNENMLAANARAIASAAAETAARDATSVATTIANIAVAVTRIVKNTTIETAKMTETATRMTYRKTYESECYWQLNIIRKALKDNK